MTNLIDIPYEEVCIYDPILTDSEKNILRKLNLQPLETNHEGHYLYEKSKPIFFDPCTLTSFIIKIGKVRGIPWFFQKI